MPLPYSFFNRSAIKVARSLLGCTLARKRGGKIERFIIIETEAYSGLEDKASHASRGMTKRNSIMFKSAGHIYVYFTYGMHWMLNIVTDKVNRPSAVLIRGLKSLDGKIVLNGPAKLTKALGIDGKLNGLKLGKTSGLWVEKGKNKIAAMGIRRAPRIGVDYAGPVWAKKKWRFVLKD